MMKRISAIFFTLIICFLFAANLNAQPDKNDKSKSTTDKIKWYTFEEAVKLNRKKPKKIFLDVYTDWCGWCKKYDAVTFANPVIAKYLNENYYPVKFNAESKETINFNGKDYINQNPNANRSSHQLAQFLLQGRMSYPTVVFLNEKLELISPVPGFMQPKEFEVLINFIGDNSYSKTKFEDYKSSFKGKLSN